MKLSYLLILTILPMMLVPVSAYDLSVDSINTIYHSYDNEITISGSVNSISYNSPILLTLIKGGGIIDIDQISNTEEGLFEKRYFFNPEWETDNYTVRVNHEEEKVYLEFEYIVELPPNNLFVSIDKIEYVEGEIIVINGYVDPIIENSPVLIQIIHEEGIAAIAQTTVAQDGSYTQTFMTGDASWSNSGEYVIQVRYNELETETTFRYTASFETDSHTIVVQTDKSDYYVGENILVSGTMTNIVWSENTDVLYEIYAEQTILESGTVDTLNDDGTFNFTIDTSANESWGYYSGYVELVITIQNYTSSAFFNYYNTPNMSNEVLYNTIADNINTLTIQNEMILSLQEELAALTLLVNILLEIDLMDAPKIIGLIADDPDNLNDMYDIGDTITILFDSDTNMPGGTELLRKVSIDNLFTFSDYMGSAYQGMWVNASAFEITVKSVDNALITINSTTVTPALETLILPADNNQVNFSYETSPVLTGDWGIPTQ